MPLDYICPQYLKCKQNKCPHAILHDPIPMRKREFEHDCNIWASRGICPFDPEQKVIKCVDSTAELLHEYEKGLNKFLN
jgi:hypothetical protein